MSLPGYLDGKWTFSISWNTPTHPTSSLTATLMADGTIDVQDTPGSSGIWIQGTEQENPRVSISLTRDGEQWVFEGTTNSAADPTQMSGASVGAIRSGTYYRGAWLAERQSP